MHNDIMAAGSKERPPMLALGPYEINLIQLPNTPDDDNPGQPNKIVKEIYGDTTLHNQKLIDAEVEAVHMILNGIGNDIYSTMDVCLNAKEMCIDIERDGESVESYYTQFYRLINEMFVNHTTLIVAGNKETIGNKVVQQCRIQCFNCKGFGHFAKECIKPKEAKDYEYYKQKMMLCKQESKGISLSAKQSEWLSDINEEPDEQEQEAHYMYMAKIQEDERVLLAYLIANLKLDVDENKKIQKQFKKANMSPNQELEKNKRALKDYRCLISKESYCVALKLIYQNQALKSGQYGRVLKDIDDIETINIELEHSVAKLLQQNEILYKENKQVKQTYKDLYDYTKKIRNQIKVNSDSLIENLNKKSIENADLKAQLQDKTNVNAKMRNMLNKMKGNLVVTNFEDHQLFDNQVLLDFKNHQSWENRLCFQIPSNDNFFPKSRFPPETNEKKDLSKPVTLQILPQNEKEKQVKRNTNVIKPGMYRVNTKSTQTRTPQLSYTYRNTNPRVCTSTRVINKTSVSIPQLRSTQIKEKIMPNNSQVMLKKKGVEDCGSFDSCRSLSLKLI
uniref:CCHC-type domain-containing protein n=1 Tax=Tanacetum cinerariifolium TaxID=118510 RepID=A0A699HEX0_TANCI|nr:hypothetical protein [Tanacetum cinerariifolium]